jgi:hypothetical protein
MGLREGLPDRGQRRKVSEMSDWIGLIKAMKEQTDVLKEMKALLEEVKDTLNSIRYDLPQESDLQ